MAKTLQEYKKEFEALKKLIPPTVDKVESNEHNLDKHREMLVDAFQEVGLRIHKLRDAGTQGTKLENFMGDRELATMIKELQSIRETAKKTALDNKNLYEKDFKVIKTRMKNLQDGLTTEIAARKKKFSSRKLGINQSVKEMEPLLAEVNKFVKGGNQDYTFLFNYQGSYPPAQFDRLYDDLLNEELKKSKAVALSAFQLQMQKQMLDTKNLQKAFNVGKGHFQEVLKASTKGRQGQKDRNPLTLGSAKRDAADAYKKLQEHVEPYEKAVNDATIKKMLAHSPDKTTIEKGTKALFDMVAKAKEAVEELEGRVLA